MTLKVAIVGCGKIADGHVEEIQKMPAAAQVVAVADLELLMAEQLAARYGIPAHYTDFDQLLAREKPDVVHITTPPGSHLALATRAIDAGAHVYVEKPLTLDYAGSRRLVDHACRAKRQLTIGYSYLFDPPALAMRELLAHGVLGNPVHVESFYGYNLAGPFGAAIMGDASHWVHRLPGKLVHNNLNHILYKIPDFLPDDRPEESFAAAPLAPLAISASGYVRRKERHGDARDELVDELRVVVRGGPVSVYGTFSSHIKPTGHFTRVYGTKSTLHVDYVMRTVTLDAQSKLPSAIGRLVPAFDQGLQYLREGGRNLARFAMNDFHYFSGMNRLFAMFYERIAGGGPPPIPYRDILRIAAMMNEIVRQVPGEDGVKILVTGATGFLGTALVERLLARGEGDIRCFLRGGSNRSRLDNLARRHPRAAIELFVGTLGSEEGAARALDGVSVVYHLAASLAGVAADIFLNTVVASKHLLDAISAAGRPIKVVLVSSFGVYGVANLPRGHVVDEDTPLERRPSLRDLYSHAKLRQEKLFREYQAKAGFPLVVMRPGVIYGPRGSRISSRVGLDLMGVFLHLGGDNVLPLTYVENCAEAIAVAGQREEANGQTYNVVDDDLPTCEQYLARYRREVEPLRAVRIPYPAMLAISAAVQRYHAFSKGQLPAIFTPYKTATSWKGNRFDNARLKRLGWKQVVPTDDGVRRAFEHFRSNPR